jgi:hypothetical protein
MARIDHKSQSPRRNVKNTLPGAAVLLKQGGYSFPLCQALWNHAKARLAKLFVAIKEEFKSALFSITFSIQRS